MHTCVGWGPWGQSRGPVAFTWIQTTPLLQAKSVLLGAEPDAADLDSGRMLEHRTPAHTKWLPRTGETSPLFPQLGLARQTERPVTSPQGCLTPSQGCLPPGLTSMTRIVLCTNALRIFKSAIDFQTANKNVFIRRGSP